MLRRKLFSLALVLTLALMLLSVNAFAADSEPSLVDGYYEIYTTDQLYWFAEQVNGGDTAINGKLMADIVVNENVLNEDGTLNGDGSNFRVWTPIGNSSNDYVGTFDGNGKTVSGLYFNDASVSYVGLFGYLNGGAWIENVGVSDSCFVGSNCVGGIAGYAGVGRYYGYIDDTDNFWNSNIKNCYSVSFVKGTSSVGGIVGSLNGIVRNCHSAAIICGTKYVGGVAGYLACSEMAFECNDLDCNGCGGFWPGGRVYESYNTGVVSGTEYVGGVAGCNHNVVRNCFYLEGCVSNVNSYGTAMTAEQFASGEVAYLLQGDQEELIWGQKIGTDLYPVLGGEKVYFVNDTYSNTDIPVFTGGYYEIYTADQLYWFAEQVNGGSTSINGKLMADIVVNENVLNADGTLNGDGSNFRAWTPIGNYEKIYTGTFEGNGKTVSGLYVNDTTKDCLGLIGYVGAGGLLQNVGVVDSYLQGDDYVGGVVGENHGSVTNCYHTGCVMGDSLVGGVLGYNDGTVSGCYNTGAVIGSTYNIGGVAGRNYVGTISDCYNSGSVTSSNYNVGGIVGYNDGTVTNSYNVGDVSSSRFNVGGVAGRNYGGTIINCYNNGSVTGSYSVGGVAAKSFDGEISNCYNIGIINGDYDIGGVIGCVDNGNDVTANCYYLSNCMSGGSSYGTAVTAEQLASGQVAYLLGQAFGQAIGTDTAPILNGKVVYQNQIGGCCADSFVYDYSNTQADAVTTHSWVEATCTDPKTCADCGAIQGNALDHGTLTYSFGNNTHILTCDVCGEPALTKNSTDGKQFKFNTAAPALSVDIVMNIAVTLPAGFENPSMVIEFNGKTTTLNEYTINASNGRYEFAFPGINPQTMGDSFVATLYADMDGTQVSIQLTYSMMKYINSQLKKTTISAELRTALSDLVMYGEANQVYEGYKTDALLSTLLEATATLTPSTFSELDGSFYKQATSGTKDANIDLKGITVALGSKVAVRMTLQCAEAAAYSVKVNLHGVDYVWAVSDLALVEGYTDRYAVEFDQIKATQFDEIITFSFLDADGNQVGRTLEYTVYSYVQRNQDNPDEALAKLLQAIYSYGEAVKKI